MCNESCENGVITGFAIEIAKCESGLLSPEVPFNTQRLKKMCVSFSGEGISGSSSVAIHYVDGQVMFRRESHNDP